MSQSDLGVPPKPTETGRISDRLDRTVKKLRNKPEIAHGEMTTPLPQLIQDMNQPLTRLAMQFFRVIPPTELQQARANLPETQYLARKEFFTRVIEDIRGTTRLTQDEQDVLQVFEQQLGAGYEAIHHIQGKKLNGEPRAAEQSELQLRRSLLAHNAQYFQQVAAWLKHHLIPRYESAKLAELNAKVSVEDLKPATRLSANAAPIEQRLQPADEVQQRLEPQPFQPVSDGKLVVSQSQANRELQVTEFPSQPEFFGSVERDRGTKPGIFVHSIYSLANERGGQTLVSGAEAALALPVVATLGERPATAIDVTLPMKLVGNTFAIPSPLGYTVEAAMLLTADGSSIEGVSQMQATRNEFGQTTIANVPSTVSEIRYRLIESRPSIDAKAHPEWLNNFPSSQPRPEARVVADMISKAGSVQEKVRIIAGALRHRKPVYTTDQAFQKLLVLAPNFYEFQNAIDGPIGHCEHMSITLANELRQAGIPAVKLSGLVAENTDKPHEQFSTVGHAQVAYIDEHGQVRIAEATSVADRTVALNLAQLRADQPAAEAVLQTGNEKEIRSYFQAAAKRWKLNDPAEARRQIEHSGATTSQLEPSENRRSQEVEDEQEYYAAKFRIAEALAQFYERLPLATSVHELYEPSRNIRKAISIISRWQTSLPYKTRERQAVLAVEQAALADLRTVSDEIRRWLAERAPESHELQRELLHLLAGDGVSMYNWAEREEAAAKNEFFYVSSNLISDEVIRTAPTEDLVTIVWRLPERQCDTSHRHGFQPSIIRRFWNVLRSRSDFRTWVFDDETTSRSSRMYDRWGELLGNQIKPSVTAEQALTNAETFAAYAKLAQEILPEQGEPLVGGKLLDILDREMDTPEQTAELFRVLGAAGACPGLINAEGLVTNRFTEQLAADWQQAARGTERNSSKDIVQFFIPDTRLLFKKLQAVGCEPRNLITQEDAMVVWHRAMESVYQKEGDPFPCYHLPNGTVNPARVASAVIAAVKDEANIPLPDPGMRDNRVGESFERRSQSAVFFADYFGITDEVMETNPAATHDYEAAVLKSFESQITPYSRSFTQKEVVNVVLGSTEDILQAIRAKEPTASFVATQRNFVHTPRPIEERCRLAEEAFPEFKTWVQSQYEYGQIQVVMEENLPLAERQQIGWLNRLYTNLWINGDQPDHTLMQVELHKDQLKTGQLPPLQEIGAAFRTAIEADLVRPGPARTEISAMLPIVSDETLATRFLIGWLGAVTKSWEPPLPNSQDNAWRAPIERMAPRGTGVVKQVLKNAPASLWMNQLVNTVVSDNIVNIPNVLAPKAEVTVNEPLDTILAGSELLSQAEALVLDIPRAIEAGRRSLFKNGFVQFITRYGSALFGRSSSGEFHELREYQPGDEAKNIDWNASARTNKTIVRENREQNDPEPYHYVVDLSWLGADPNPDKLAPGIKRLLSILFEGMYANKKQELHLSWRGVVLLSVNDTELRKLFRAKETVKDELSERTRLADFLVQLQHIVRVAQTIDASTAGNDQFPALPVAQILPNGQPWMPSSKEGTAFLLTNNSESLRKSSSLFRHWLKRHIDVVRLNIPTPQTPNS